MALSNMAGWIAGNSQRLTVTAACLVAVLIANDKDAVAQAVPGSDHGVWTLANARAASSASVSASILIGLLK